MLRGPGDQPAARLCLQVTEHVVLHTRQFQPGTCLHKSCESLWPSSCPCAEVLLDGKNLKFHATSRQGSRVWYVDCHLRTPLKALGSEAGDHLCSSKSRGCGISRAVIISLISRVRQYIFCFVYQFLILCSGNSQSQASNIYAERMCTFHE